MNITRKLSVLISTGLIAMLPVVSQAQIEDIEFSANMALTNDYKFYGFSQSNEGWAIQGGIDFAHESGFYFGTWASSIDFASGAADPATIELDVYAGFAGELANGLGWDIGVVRYGYPSQTEDVGAEYEYYEVQLSFEYAFGGEWNPTLSAGVWVSPDWFGEDGTSVYPNGTLSVELPSGFGLYGTVGHLNVEGDKTSGPAGFDYTHYQIGVTKDFAGLSFDFAWADAGDDCDGGTGEFCEGFVFYVSKEF